jgi:pimeloyl-ACP methyl ester carboxylesterase
MSYDYNADLDKIRIEHVMILVRQNDSAISPREVSLVVAEQILGAKYVLIEDVGHLPPFHSPSACNTIAVEFLHS